MKCSRSKTVRPRKLKSSHHVDVMRTFHLSMPRFGIRTNHIIVHTLWFALYFFVYTTLTLLKSLQWMSLGILSKFQANQKVKKTMKSLNNVWNQSMFTKLFWLSLNSPNLPEGHDTFQMIQKHPAQTTWKVFRQPCKFPDNLKIFQTIWQLSRQSWKFSHNLESLQTTWKLYKQLKLSRKSGKFTENHETFKESWKFPVNLKSFQTI